MKFSNVVSTLATAAVAFAMPIKRESGKGFSDTDVLQYVLSLEHIETAFYQQGITNFTADTFAQAGYPPYVRARYEQIVVNEKTHVDMLMGVLVAKGVKPVEACTYTFPVTTLAEFVKATRTFENVGSSAWNYAVAVMDDIATASLAGAILSVEARQAAWIGATVFHQNPWNTPFENPLNFRQIYTLSKPYIVSCPEDRPFILGYNETFPPLEVTLNYTNTNAASPSSDTTSEYTEPSPPTNRTATFTFSKPTSDTPQQPQLYHAAFIQGNGTQFSPIDPETGAVELPEGLSGYLYALVTSENGAVSDEKTVAGPTVLQFPFNSRGEGIVEVEVEMMAKFEE